jgi:hypothetical protein
MKRSILSFWLLVIVMNLSSQSYHFDSIPDNLKRGADAVVRTDQCLFTLLKPGKATLKVKKAVTLLNDFTNGYRHLAVPYNSFSRVKYVKGNIYDEKGKIIKILGILDIQDMSAVTGESFYSDERMKYLYFPIYKYPYTIEYEYEIEYTSLLNYPEWSFQDSRDVSVERSGIQIIVPENMKLRYYEKNLMNGIDSVVLGNEKIYTWQEENIPANPERKFFLPEEINLPVLYPAPLDFEFGGYSGSMNSWKSFGLWVYTLIKDRDKLPEPELSKVSQIVSAAKDQREKVKLIYEYVQSKTRYVSIDIGIGGFQPAEASAVAINGFGDCKALVNYTKALLSVAGINSFYTLVYAGTAAADKELNTKFVDNHFNHIILCVPMQNDTVWLECTNQTSPFNYLGNFTNDRNVLLITPEGGKLVKTPSFSQDENILKRTGSIFINTLGASTEKIVNQYSGYYFDVASSSYAMDSEEEIKRNLSATLGFSDFTLTNASYSEIKSEKPVASLSYNLFVNDFATAAGKRFFFNPSLSAQDYLQDQPAAMEISEHQIYTDSISYILPGGYHVENLPHNVNFDNEFGRFNYQLEVKNDRIVYQRYLKINKGIIPVSKFQELRKFINSIAQSDRQRISLAKNI